MCKKSGLPQLTLLGEEGQEWKFASLLSHFGSNYQVETMTVSSLTQSNMSTLSDRDLIFLKSKDDTVLDQMETIEASGKVRVVNRISAVRASKERAKAIALASSVGIPTPDDFCGLLSNVPFSHFAAKGEFDDNKSIPEIIQNDEQRRSLLHVRRDTRVYAQAYIESEWEYKVYGVGGTFFAFRQHPTLINPNKLETRERIKLSSELESLAASALEAVGLEVGGVDFLGKPGCLLLTDINSTQGLHNFEGGYQALQGYLKQCLAER